MHENSGSNLSGGKTRSDSATPASTSDQPPPKGWKRPVVWIGTFVGAIFIAIATAFGTGAGQGLYTAIFGSHSPGGPAVTIDSVMYETAQGAYTAAFPQVLNTQQIVSFDKTKGPFSNFMASVTSTGGAVVGDAAIQIVLTGNSNTTSIIAGMQVVQHCAAPLAGTLLFAPGAAVDTNVEIGFNLDASFPTAQDYRVGNLSGNFFTEHTISLRRGESQTLLVHALTGRQYCQFNFQLAVDTAGKQITEVIKDHGRPFVVTAAMHSLNYRSLYIGGVASPKTSGAFEKVSAKTVRQSMGVSP